MSERGRDPAGGAGAIARDHAATTASRASAGPIPRGYRGLDGVRAAAARHGARAIGVTRGGRELLAFTIGERGPATLVLAGIHPIEWIGVEVALALAEALAVAPPADRRIVIVPLLNVDGYAAIEDDLRAGRHRWRRTSGPDARSLGVDLNRNFATAHRPPPPWWRWLPHAGPAPWSEPEPAAVAALFDQIGPVDRAIALHSFGRMILLPWAHRGDRPPRWDELLAHGRAIAARMPERYRVWQAGRWPGFRAGGLEVDWLTERGALTVLIECSGGGWRATDPSTWRSPFAWYNPPDGATAATPIADALVGFARGR